MYREKIPAEHKITSSMGMLIGVVMQKGYAHGNDSVMRTVLFLK
jgi:hypothetical protein